MLRAIYFLPLEYNSGKAPATGTSQKTCRAKPFHCFRGKSVESNEPDKSSIISFTTLIQRKYVLINSAKFIMVSGRREFARTLLNVKSDKIKKEETYSVLQKYLCSILLPIFT